MKYLLIALVILASGMLYFMHQSNKAAAERLAQAEITNQKRLEQNKIDAINAEKAAQTRRLEAEKSKQLKSEDIKLITEKRDQDFKQEQQEKTLKAVKAIEEKARRNLFDPDAAKFRNIKGNCGEINAKNKVGGYTGYRRFIYDKEFDSISIEGDEKDFYAPWMMDILWEKKCP